MNRENKKKSFEKDYYKTHSCNESFVCKVCGETVTPTGAGKEHHNHCRIVYPVSIGILRVAIVKQIAEVL